MMTLYNKQYQIFHRMQSEYRPQYENTHSTTDLCCSFPTTNLNSRNQTQNGSEKSVNDLDLSKTTSNKNSIHTLLRKKSPAKTQLDRKIENQHSGVTVRKTQSNREFQIMTARITELETSVRELSIQKYNIELEKQQFNRAYNEFKHMAENDKNIIKAHYDKILKDLAQQNSRIKQENMHIKNKLANQTSQLDTITLLFDEQTAQINILQALVSDKNQEIQKINSDWNAKILNLKKSFSQEIKGRLSCRLLEDDLDSAEPELIIAATQKKLEQLILSKQQLEQRHQSTIQLGKTEEIVFKSEIDSLKYEIKHKDEEIKHLKEINQKEKDSFTSAKNRLLQEINLCTILNSQSKQGPKNTQQEIAALKLQNQCLRSQMTKPCEQCKTLGKTVINLSESLKQLKHKQNEEYSEKINDLINSSVNCSVNSSKHF